FAPLSSREADRLRAGDDVLITADLLLLAVEEDEASGQTEVVPPAIVEGRICCLATDGSGRSGGPRWRIAQIDAPEIDRLALSILAAGARACIARGPCSAALSYALRKYRGVYFAVEADWLQRIAPDTIVVDPDRSGSIPHAIVEVDQVLLTVTHDSQG